MSTESSSDTLLQLAFTDRNLNYISVVNFSVRVVSIRYDSALTSFLREATTVRYRDRNI